MAIIIETCPKCGYDLIDEVICTYPPIPAKHCPSCGWHWEGKQEEIIRIPFGGNSWSDNKTINDYLEDLTVLNTDIGLDNTIATPNFGQINTVGFEQSPCDSCSNNPKNGGSGICFCILGTPKIT